MTTLLQRVAPFIFPVLPLITMLVAGTSCERKQSEETSTSPTEKEKPTESSESPRTDSPAVIQVPPRILQLCEEDPQRAAREAMSTGPGFQIYGQLLRHLFKQDPQLAFDIFVANFENFDGSPFYHSAFVGFDGADLEQLRRLQDRLPEHFEGEALKKMRGVLLALHARIDPGAALRVMEESSDYQVPSFLLEPLVTDLCRADLERTIELSDKGSSVSSKLAWQRALAALARKHWLSDKRPELAKLLLKKRQQNHTAYAAQFLYDFIGRSNSYDLELRFVAAVDLLEHETPERRATLRAALITEFLPKHFDLLHKHLSRDDLSPAEFAAGGSALAEYHGFENALAWAAEVPRETGGEHALKGVATKWMKHDSKEAGRGIGAQQPGLVRDVLIEAVVEELVRKGATDDAREWLGSVQDPGKRTKLQNVIDGKEGTQD